MNSGFGSKRKLMKWSRWMDMKPMKEFVYLRLIFQQKQGTEYGIINGIKIE